VLVVSHCSREYHLRSFLVSHRHVIVLNVLFVLLSAVVGSAWGANSYTLTDLGTLPGHEATSGATGINATWQVVGNSYVYGLSNAFLYSGGSMQYLGTFGSAQSFATGINDGGLVVGYTWSPTDPYRSFLYDGGGPLQELSTLGGRSTYAAGINNDGQIVGWSNTSDSYHAFRCIGTGPMQDLGTLGGVGSEATAINNGGQVVGIADTASTPYSAHAFLYSGSGPMQDLGTLGGRLSEATALNERGQVVGWSNPTDSDAKHAFLFDGIGPMQDLGTLGGTTSWAAGINDSGQVVGWSPVGYNYYGDPIDHGFLYENGTMFDLNSLIPSGWTLYGATAINDDGQIVGMAQNTSTGDQHAVLLTPVPVPEPTTLVLLGLGAIGILVRARRRA
jgi:probable HAF family extracellular repeat protein